MISVEHLVFVWMMEECGGMEMLTTDWADPGNWSFAYVPTVYR